MSNNKPPPPPPQNATGLLIWMIVLSTLSTISLLAGILMFDNPERRILAMGAIGLAVILESGALVMMMRWIALVRRR